MIRKKNFIELYWNRFQVEQKKVVVNKAFHETKNSRTTTMKMFKIVIRQKRRENIEKIELQY